MTNYDREPADFQELVSWACWKFIEGLTKGEPLRVTVFGILDYARRWKPAA
jgi:hypothetical protein